jgi:hypothetical protein
MNVRKSPTLERLSLALMLAWSAVAFGCGGAASTNDTGASSTEPSGAATPTHESHTGHAEPAAAAGASAAKPVQSTQAQPPAATPAQTETGMAASAKDPESKFCGVLDTMRSSCQRCHGATPVAGAPMPLVTYQDFLAPGVTNPQRKVYELVQERVHDQARPMPPAPAQLSAAELTGIDAWVSGGALEAAKTCPEAAPTTTTTPPGTLTEGEFQWPADCEERHTFVAHDADDKTKPYMVPANTEEHPAFMFDPPWGDDDVQMLASRPITDNAKVVHHWILWDATQGSSLAGWAPGGIPDDLPSDVGLYMPKGQGALTLDLHYYNLNGGEPQPDSSGLEVCISRKLRPKTAANTGLNGSAVVKAMSSASTPVMCQVTTTEEVRFLGINPHMHQLGTHAKLELTRGGMTSVIWDAPFKFTEQAMRPLDNIPIMTGDVLTTTCTHVNDRPTDVQWGESTDDEMCINWVRYYPKGAFTCKRMNMNMNMPQQP